MLVPVKNVACVCRHSRYRVCGGLDDWTRCAPPNGRLDGRTEAPRNKLRCSLTDKGFYSPQANKKFPALFVIELKRL